MKMSRERVLFLIDAFYNSFGNFGNMDCEPEILRDVRKLERIAENVFGDMYLRDHEIELLAKVEEIVNERSNRSPADF